MTGHRVLVTGAGGFIGRSTLGPLCETGAEVHAVTRGETPRAGTADVVWHHVDLHERRAVEALVAAVRPSHLLHLAWCVEPATYLTALENLRWVGSTLDLADAFARAGGRRLTVAGTSIEYESGHGVCVEGRTPIAPATLYATCKRSVHDVLERWSTQVGVSVGWGRVFSLHGPGESPVRLVPQLIRAGVTGTPFPMRFPAQIRDYTHVADVGRALAALLGSDVRGAVNIASGEPVVLADLARHVGECLGEPVLLDVGATGADPVPVLVADTARLRTEVGFTPRYSLAEGLRDTVAWWKTSGHLVLT